MIRVLVIDDSALMRQLLSTILSQDPEIEVIATAPDPYVARDKIKALNPDVLTLDVEMPRMDGITFLEKLMASRPMPVIMVSSLTETGCETTLRALELGAIDYFTKPKLDMQGGMEEEGKRLISMVKTAASATIRRYASNVRSGKSMTKVRPLKSSAMIKTTDTIIAIGASTGGTEALREILEVLPPTSPPILITQHMPEYFTRQFALRLDTICHISIKEAEDGDSVLVGHALIAPGNHHMVLERSGARYKVRLSQDPPVNRHRPSVDVMFDSVAENAGRNAIGVILTGMGKDGAEGMKEMKKAGAYNYAQDEASCVVFGMPKEAIALGSVDEVLPLREMPGKVIGHLSSLEKAKTSK